jgi:hypothetical protein
VCESSRIRHYRSKCATSVEFFTSGQNVWRQWNSSVVVRMCHSTVCRRYLLSVRQLAVCSLPILSRALIITSTNLLRYSVIRKVLWIWFWLLFKIIISDYWRSVTRFLAWCCDQEDWLHFYHYCGLNIGQMFVFCVIIYHSSKYFVSLFICLS